VQGPQTGDAVGFERIMAAGLQVDESARLEAWC
jgi:hypothetical protein